MRALVLWFCCACVGSGAVSLRSPVSEPVEPVEPVVPRWTLQSGRRVVLGEQPSGWLLGAGRVRAWVFRDGRLGSVSSPASSPFVAGARVREGWLFELADGAVLFAETPTGPTRVVQPAWREPDGRPRPPQVGALLTVRDGDVIEHLPNDVRRVPLPFPVVSARALGSRREVELPGRVRLAGTWSALELEAPEPESTLPYASEIVGRELELALFVATREGVTRPDGAVAVVLDELEETLVLMPAHSSIPTLLPLEDEGCEVISPLPGGWWLRCLEHLLHVGDDGVARARVNREFGLRGGLGFWGRCDDLGRDERGVACVATPEGLREREGEPPTRTYGPPRVPVLGVGVLACSTRMSNAPPIVDWSREDESVALAPVFARPRRLVLPPSRGVWMDDQAVFADVREGAEPRVITETSTLRLTRSAPVVSDRWTRAEVAREGDGFVVLFRESAREELVRFTSDGARVHARWLGPGGRLAEGPDGRVRAAYPLRGHTRWAAYDADERRPVTGFSFGPAPWAAHVCRDVPANAWRVRMGQAALDLGDPDELTYLEQLVVAVGDGDACVVDVLESLNGALRREDGRLVGRVEENGTWEVSCDFLPPEPILAGLIAC